MKINLAVHTSRSVENALRTVTKNEAEMEEKNCFKKEGISLKRQSKWNVCVMVLTSIEIFQLDFCLEAAVFHCAIASCYLFPQNDNDKTSKCIHERLCIWRICQISNANIFLSSPLAKELSINVNCVLLVEGGFWNVWKISLYPLYSQ